MEESNQETSRKIEELGGQMDTSREIEELNGRISSKKEEITKLYYKLGKYTYEKDAEGRDRILSDVTGNIDRINAEIKEINILILDKKGLRLCHECGDCVDKKLMYCGKCGAKMPVEIESAKDGIACTRCGSIMKDGIKFCTSCGNRLINEEILPDVCPKCGNEIKKNAAYCTECGMKVR